MTAHIPSPAPPPGTHRSHPVPATSDPLRPRGPHLRPTQSCPHGAARKGGEAAPSSAGWPPGASHDAPSKSRSPGPGPRHPAGPEPPALRPPCFPLRPHGPSLSWDTPHVTGRPVHFKWQPSRPQPGPPPTSSSSTYCCDGSSRIYVIQGPPPAPECPCPGAGGLCSSHVCVPSVCCVQYLVHCGRAVNIVG